MHTDLLFNLTIKKIHAVFSIYNEKNREMKQKNRPLWAVILKYEGETVYTCNGNKYISNLQNMIILPKGSSYEWQCTKSGRFYTIEFDSDDTCDTIFSFPISDYEKYLQFYKDSEYKKNLKKPIYKIELLKNLYSILLLLLKTKTPSYTSSAKYQKIEPAVDFLYNHYNEPIRNDDLAKLTGLSTIYFRKIFTEHFGVSPITYLHKLRIKKAKEILRSDYESITNIAYSLGYSDVCDFSHTFKKYVGLSPTQFSKLHQSNTE